jgi:hypothetical protein
LLEPTMSPSQFGAEYDGNESQNSDNISSPESGSHASRRSIGWLVGATIAGAALIITLLLVFLSRRRRAKTILFTEGPSILPVHCREGPLEETS